MPRGEEAWGGSDFEADTTPGDDGRAASSSGTLRARVRDDGITRSRARCNARYTWPATGSRHAPPVDSCSALASVVRFRRGRVGLARHTLYRFYRNTDKSHAFERETSLDVKPVTGSDAKVGTITGTQATRIQGDNVGAYRLRVQRVPVEADATPPEADDARER